MERDYTIKDTAFTRWLLDQARSAGWDVDDDQETRKTIRLTAALIRTSGVAVVDAPRLAAALGVTVEEIQEAVRPELTANEAAARLFDQPGMGELDARLDAVAWPDGPGKKSS
ncbi:hypothetical protein ACIHFE_17970 [Streptomyces sp. NPDC052396]|uniref:hypothetical protein n=1 Tax=Streptomyces sp. NPDC052396 TaxID=3365689 RepID=UPI0037D41F56